MKVTLEDYEILIGATIGVMRQIAAMKRGLPDRHGYTGDGWGIHINGACGEIAGAKALGCYWPATINTFGHGPDLGDGRQVRHSEIGHGCLLIRPSDPDNRVYVAVFGVPPILEVAGWMTGTEAKQERWERAPNGRPPAWFVPQTELHDLDLLRYAVET